MFSPVLIGIGILVVFIFSGLRLLNEWDRGVILRLGKFVGVKQAGLQWIIPFVDRLIRVDLRLATLDIPPQDVITRDNVSIKVNAVMNFRVVDPEKSIISALDYFYTTSQLAQTTLRSVLGQVELDELLAHRDKINSQLQTIIDKQTDPLGVKVALVEVKHIDLPKEMQRAMAKQAEAERERRAKVIAAEGEYQAADKLAEAAKVIADHPMALQFRYLQTLVEVASENNSTTIFPIPIDLLTPFIKNLPKA